MESTARSKKLARTESLTKDNDDIADDFDETLFHYYQSRSEHTVKLADEQMKLDQKIDEEEEAGSHRLCWNNIKGDDKRCIVFTGFSSLEIFDLLHACENDIPINMGRGKKSKFSRADKFLIVLCYLKLIASFLLPHKSEKRNYEEFPDTRFVMLFREA